MFAPRYFAPRYWARRYFPTGTDAAPIQTGSAGAANRFRSAVVPSFGDLDEVQRFLQRTMDEIARALNPVRSVADGGTGIDALERGELLVGGETTDQFDRVKGNPTAQRMFLVSLGSGALAGVPFWDTLQPGDLDPAGGGGGGGPVVDTVVIGADSVVAGADSVVI